MQNLSLQVAQTAPVKGISDASNKNDSNADKSATEPNNSFQMLLSRQVLAKQTQENIDRQTSAQQASSKQALANQASASQAPVKQPAAEHVATQEKPKATTATAEADVSKAKKADVKKTDADVASAAVVPGVQIELDAKGLPVKKEDTDTKSENAGITAVDASAIAAIPAISAPIINATPLVTTTSTTDAQLLSGGESASQKQQSLDTVLSNALSQGKGANGMEKGGVDKDVVDATGGKTASDHARWLDVMLPNASKQTISDDSATAKLMLNAINESAGKDAITPTASYQPTAQASATQMNAGLAAQQLGSSNMINAYPGKSGWDQAISQKVMWMVGAGEQTASLTLNPPDMGPLQVVISVNNDKADTTFISDNPEVRKALEDGMANLRDKMNDSGIQLGQANVSSGGQAQQQFEQAQQNRMAAAQSNNGTAPQPEKTGNTNPVVRVSNGLVDTFA